MKQKFIIQIKRFKLWEDIVVYDNPLVALQVLNNLRKNNPNLIVRCLEVFHIA